VPCSEKKERDLRLVFELFPILILNVQQLSIVWQLRLGTCLLEPEWPQAQSWTGVAALPAWQLWRWRATVWWCDFYETGSEGTAELVFRQLRC
jgi:hypothetical protein